LVELMVVLGVFGILLAIVAPPMAGYLRSSRLIGATNTLVADLYYTRGLADAQRRTYEVRFGPTAYSIVRLSPLSTVRTRALPRGVRFSAPDTATFFAWGLTNPTIINMANQDRSRVIRLAANGRVVHD
jgi:type II secretory pathway pseudopilin PulG